MTHRTQDQTPALSWAAYLGASWTWCIGMFLPVLLIRDYGAWAWVIFAVPNCLGAAAMGWVMRSPDHSRAYVRNHAAACRLFSLVTIAFQFFFAIWILPHLVGLPGFAGVLLIAIAAFVYVSPRHRVLAAPLILTISVMAAVIMGTRGALVIPQTQPFALGDVIGLSLVCLAGFLTCPYLDLTFHRARQHTTARGAKIAFGVGFCGHFLLMIIFTLLYATYFYRLAGIAAILLAIHYTVQIAYTVSLHQAELIDGSEAGEIGLSRGILAAALAIALIGGIAAQIAQQNGVLYHGLMIGEIIYRGFLAFYGLIFPAYVCLAIARSRVPSIAWIAVILLAAPFYWFGFIEAKMVWASGGVGVILAASLLAFILKRPAAVLPSE